MSRKLTVLQPTLLQLFCGTWIGLMVGLAGPLIEDPVDLITVSFFFSFLLTGAHILWDLMFQWLLPVPGKGGDNAEG